MLTQSIVQTLKKTVKAKGWTYARLAVALHKSEPSIKRLFTGKGNLTLERLEAICECIDADVVSIVQSSALVSTKPKVTYEQELELAQDIKRLIFFTALRKGVKLKKVLETYKVSTKESDLYLKQLEKMGLLERHAGDRIKIQVDQSVQWIEGGPVRSLYAEDMKQTYLNAAFSGNNEFCHFITLQFSPESMKMFSRKIEKLQRELQELVLLDQHLPYEKKQTTTFLVASRSWVPTQAKDFIR